VGGPFSFRPLDRYRRIHRSRYGLGAIWHSRAVHKDLSTGQSYAPKPGSSGKVSRMFRLTSLVAAALLSATAIAHPVLSQDAPTGVGTGVIEDGARTIYGEAYFAPFNAVTVEDVLRRIPASKMLWRMHRTHRPSGASDRPVRKSCSTAAGCRAIASPSARPYNVSRSASFFRWRRSAAP